MVGRIKPKFIKISSLGTYSDCHALPDFASVRRIEHHADADYEVRHNFERYCHGAPSSFSPQDHIP